MRYAVIAIGDGGRVLEATRFAAFAEAQAAQRRVARDCAEAHRVLFIDARSGQRISEARGRGAAPRR